MDIEKIAARLPFHLDDVDQVNDAFERWRLQGEDQDHYVIALWTYCFVRRYFVTKFVSGFVQSDVATLDILIEQAYERVQTRQDELVDAQRYASWVSVICKNTFLNFLRRQLVFTSIDQEAGPLLQAEVKPATYDIGILLEGLRQAIERLPNYLKEVARLRLLEKCSYQEIEERTGIPIASVRTYVHKTLVKIRSDTEFLGLIGWSDSKDS
ncbi:MAG TPA: sigma-70 family RNA polymerase sigma factor [Rhodothermales bacterium]|nr:sigma-70 family RNA polymerase sigma factor [Rhodothermales bacterium]